MVPVLTLERGFLGVGGFVLLLLAESIWPFRQRVESRWRRYAINVFILSSNALLLSVLLGGLIVATSHSFELHRIGLLHRWGIGSWWNVAVTMVVLDGVTYLWHRAYHGVPAMWRMHRVHHSDRDLDVTSSGRFHLTEMVLSAIFRLGVIALLGATVAGVVLFEIVFGLLNQLQHANLRLPEPLETALRWVFVTPDMHRLHHSQRTEHTNSNYSTIFSWWDRLGGTYRFGDEQRTLTIGLPEYQRPGDVTFGKVLAMPFGRPCAAWGLAPNSTVAKFPAWGLTLGIVLLSVAAFALVGYGSPAVRPHKAGSDFKNAQRPIVLSYVAHIRAIPPSAQELHVWIPLARTGPEQEVIERSIRAPAPSTVTRESAYGNEMAYLALHAPLPAELAVSIAYRALLRPGTQAAEGPSSSAQWARYQAPEGLMVIDDEVRARAQRATAGRTSLVARTRGIYDAVIRQMTYDKQTLGWGQGDTRRACLLGKGNCTDFHSLFISMARAERIPARFKIGVVIPQQPSGVIPGYHCWAEFYTPGRGWVPVDASEAWKHPELAEYYFGARDPNRFLISVGRDIQLVPKQQGDPANIFFAPYVEVDGQVFPDVGVEVRFADLQQGRTT